MRFIRTKALENLYTYAIAERVCQNEITEEIKQKFDLDIFLHATDDKDRLEQERKAVLTLFDKMIEQSTSLPAVVPVDQSKTEQLVYEFLIRYKEQIFQDQKRLQAELSQVKEHIYNVYVYIILLLVEWYKLAHKDTSISSSNLLKNRVVQSPLLETLCNNYTWLSTINKKYISWDQEERHVKMWYTQLDVPLELSGHNENNEVKLLQDIVRNIIFKDVQIDHFFSMMSCCSWFEYKHIVQKMLDKTFAALASNDMIVLTNFLQKLTLEWEQKIDFYNFLFQKSILNSKDYEHMICAKSEQWKSNRIVLIDKIILKLALVEILEYKQTPFKVSLNEYIEIAKLYGTSKSGQFVNGILEGIYRGEKE